MKFNILFIGVIVAIVQVKADMEEEFDQVNMACREETQVSEEDLNSFFQNYNIKPQEAIMCFLKCNMEKQGYWKSGAFDEIAAKEFLLDMPELKDQEDAVNKYIDDCKNQKGSTECETAYLITKCMTEHEALIM
ncbi:general odorant-binding protein 56h-like [Lucilia sericata]|uniref:general odorant-binding protein 56h-like n=1 Tax=Lucilia sericata TaxID=13632 RepID=UPI0018A881E4|nr:general odorant-binding protein 56h-like [Lucilia sericata]